MLLMPLWWPTLQAIAAELSIEFRHSSRRSTKVHAATLLRILFRRRRFLRQPSMYSKFLVGFFFLTGAAQRHRQIIVRRRIALLWPHGSLQWRNSLLVTLERDQAKSPAHKRIAKTRIQLRGS